ncbi:MAG: RHS repeat-associated core domain-containing protein [Blastocatellia bacterium]
MSLFHAVIPLTRFCPVLRQARYASIEQGRFISPDLLGGHQEDPQTLNRYAYVRNNPVIHTDPTGLDFYLTCTGDSATCQGGQVGKTITDAKGNKKFSATMIHSDAKGGLVDQYGKKYTATVQGDGVHFTQQGSKQSVLGVFQNGTTPTIIQGSGALAGFTFTFKWSNLEKNQTAAGDFKFNGSANQANQALERAGFNKHFLDNFNMDHPSTDTYDTEEYRTEAVHEDGTGSGHMTLHVPVVIRNFYRYGTHREQLRGTVPVSGDIHLGETYPYTLSGFIKHMTER